MPLRFPDDPLYKLLRNEKIKDFNEKTQSLTNIDFHDCDFRGLDLRGLNASGLNLNGCYFRGTDLRGIDFNSTQLNGASIAAAQISGCLFPNELSADEILLSVEKGTRMRYR